MTTTETPTSQAVEKAKPPTPAGLVRQYERSFATVLPSHVHPDQWTRVAMGALKKGRRYSDGRFELEVAASNNPTAFLSALLDAARLGLEPGTKQYYLTARKMKGRLEILGMVGYQGEIELMYRAGAVVSVIAECVYSNDQFSYQPGRDDVPLHTIDWDAPNRGELRLVYAYAKMREGATSRVVVLNKSAIERLMEHAPNSSDPKSPWQTDTAAMWLKSAVHQLAKWVPTSAEYIRERLRAARDVASEIPSGASGPFVPISTPQADVDPNPLVDPNTGEMTIPGGDDDVADAEIVDDPPEASVTAETVNVEDAHVVTDEPVPPPAPPTPTPTMPIPPSDNPATEAQLKALSSLLRGQYKVAGPDRFIPLSELAGRTITDMSQLSADEAAEIIERMQANPSDAVQDPF